MTEVHIEKLSVFKRDVLCQWQKLQESCFPYLFFWVVFCLVGFRGSGRQVEVVYIHGLGF